MTPETLFADKTLKAKARSKTIAGWLMNGELTVDELIAFASKQKAADTAVCIEALEYATAKQPEIADENVLVFVTELLKKDEPALKRESSRVIGNVAGRFPGKLNDSVTNLLANAGNEGTVVRWATAFALAEILKLKTDLNQMLLPKVETLAEKEEDNGVKKKYLDALKKVKKP
ncbi:MAG: hypothetical protein V4616_13150 [Bacteroidota bacterium]